MSVSRWILFLPLLWTFHPRDLCTVSAESKLDVTYSCNETTCILSCKGESCLAYSWKENGEVKEEGSTLMLEKSEKNGNTYTCICKSFMGEEESDPIMDNELFPGDEMKDWTAAAIIVPAVIMVVLLSALTYHCIVQKSCKGRNADVCDNIKKPSGHSHQCPNSTVGEVGKQQAIAPVAETGWNVDPDYEKAIPNHDYCVVKA